MELVVLGVELVVFWWGLVVVIVVWVELIILWVGLVVLWVELVVLIHHESLIKVWVLVRVQVRTLVTGGEAGGKVLLIQK